VDEVAGLEVVVGAVVVAGLEVDAGVDEVESVEVLVDVVEMDGVEADELLTNEVDDPAEMVEEALKGVDEEVERVEDEGL
jgi:hypothetical protein